MKKNVNIKLEKILLGFTSGIMIATSVWSLIIPSIEMAESQGLLSWIPASIGFLSGVIFLFILDKIIPSFNIDSNTSSDTKTHKNLFGQKAMMVIAITLHNIPEGMAVRSNFCRSFDGKYRNYYVSSLYFSNRNCNSKLP